MKKDLVDIFYNDIIENFECSYVTVEYMLNKNIDGFNELLNNGIDRCVEFGKNLLITDVELFTDELGTRLNEKFLLNYLDVHYDRCGNVSNILLEVEKEVM